MPPSRRSASSCAAAEPSGLELLGKVERRFGIEGYDIEGYDYDWTDPEARRVRRAQIGGYRDYLDEQDCRYTVSYTHLTLPTN